MPPLHLSLRAFALKLPNTEEGIACAGTAVESRTIKVRGKAFLFLRADDIRLKLHHSVPAATALASKHPTAYQAGSGGWTKVTLTTDHIPPLQLLQKWANESYNLLAPPTPRRAAPPSAHKASKPKPGKPKPGRPKR